MVSTLEQPLLFSDNLELPSSLFVETPGMQQECSLTLSSSEQHEKSFFCHEQICQDDSGDEVAQKYVPTVLPDQNEVLTMEEGSSYSSPSHYASPPLTSVYGSLTPMNSNTILYPWLFSPQHTTPLHHINFSPPNSSSIVGMLPNSSPIMGMLYSPPPSIFGLQLF